MRVATSARPLAAAVAGVLLLSACGDDDGGRDGVAIEDVTEREGFDYGPLGEVVEDGDQLVGQTVTVSGEVSAQINDRVFHIAAEEGTDGLLIVSEQPVVDQLDSNDVVEVTGTVREVDPSTFEEEFSVPYVEDYEAFDTRHGILATSVEVIAQAEGDGEFGD